MYSVDENLLAKKEGYIMIELSQCIGVTELQFVEDSPKTSGRTFKDRSKSNNIYAIEKHSEFGREYFFI